MASLTATQHSRIAFDQVIRITINRLCIDGGPSGNTQNPNATERWTKMHHIVVLHEWLNEKIKKRTKERHVELGTARINEMKKM